MRRARKTKRNDFLGLLFFSYVGTVLGLCDFDQSDTWATPPLCSGTLERIGLRGQEPRTPGFFSPTDQRLHSYLFLGSPLSPSRLGIVRFFGSTYGLITPTGIFYSSLNTITGKAEWSFIPSDQKQKFFGSGFSPRLEIRELSLQESPFLNQFLEVAASVGGETSDQPKTELGFHLEQIAEQYPHGLGDLYDNTPTRSFTLVKRRALKLAGLSLLTLGGIFGTFGLRTPITPDAYGENATIFQYLVDQTKVNQLEREWAQEVMPKYWLLYLADSLLNNPSTPLAGDTPHAKRPDKIWYSKMISDRKTRNDVIRRAKAIDEHFDLKEPTKLQSSIHDLFEDLRNSSITLSSDNDQVMIDSDITRRFWTSDLRIKNSKISAKFVVSLIQYLDTRIGNTTRSHSLESALKTMNIRVVRKSDNSIEEIQWKDLRELWKEEDSK